jgi:hypothetical protein
VQHLASAWAYQQNKARVLPVISYDDDVYGKGLAKRLTQMGFPVTLSEKGDRLLLCLADAVGIRYRNKIPVKAGWIAEIAAHDLDELNQVLFFLQDIEFAQAQSGGAERLWGLTARGWKRIEELRRCGVTTDSAFVAMWFDSSTERYRESVCAAIEHCGYKPIIVDQEEYTGFIMDQVITLIRQSRFVVADFTSSPEQENPNGAKVKNGARGGVYWEAGFAYGLGIPVIHTCRDSAESRRRTHFDIDQYNTIFWIPEQLTTTIRDLLDIGRNATFPEKLVTRILATIGRGSCIRQ